MRSPFCCTGKLPRMENSSTTALPELLPYFYRIPTGCKFKALLALHGLGFPSFSNTEHVDGCSRPECRTPRAVRDRKDREDLGGPGPDHQRPQRHREDLW